MGNIMNLVIVESPAKAKTIEKYLGSDYKVIASVGHIIDLPPNELGVDIEHNFEPKYIVIEGKEKVISSLKTNAKKADKVFLAPDPDREGEAIAWHIASQIDKNKPVKRVLFNEITKKGILDGINNPGDININRVNAQQSRRILDRLVGYMVSPLLWKPLRYGLSAGRVQSVALRLICEREEEIEKFVPVESWSISADFNIENKDTNDKGVLKAKLDKIKGKKANIKTEKDAEKILADLPVDFIVSGVEEKAVKQNPAEPFITSRMQQEAIRKLGFTAKKAMSVAQSLYEGVELAEGPVGLITYMRTDSTRISPEAESQAKEYIEKNYGKDYVAKTKKAAKKSNNVQDAHEAIRPTSVLRTPAEIKKYLTNDQYRLYKLIWERFVASQMAEAIFNQTVVRLTGKDYEFKASAKTLAFAGFTKLYLESKEEDAKNEEDDETTISFKISENTPALRDKTEKKQHFTQSPPRYTEATLVKTLEQQGIGRPSTYAAIISTIVERQYTELQEKKFHPTELGRIVNKILIENFPKIFEVKFTASMEKDLDLIEDGTENWHDVLSNFYKNFDKELKAASTGKISANLETNKKCPICTSELVIKMGKNGAFLACSAYPECKFTSNFKRNEKGEIELVEDKQFEGTGIKCEKCGEELVFKKTRFGEVIACPGYPECKNIKNFLRTPDGNIKILEAGQALDEKCPECSKPLTLKSGKNGMFAACSGYPECKFTANTQMKEDGTIGIKPNTPNESGEVCEKCGKPMVVKRSFRGAFLACSGYPECKNTKPIKKKES